MLLHHTEDDFNLAKLHGIKIHDIVHDNGCIKKIPLFAGVHVFKADVKVIESLKGENNLIGEEYSHSYTHSWNQKPVIYRLLLNGSLVWIKMNLKKLKRYRKYKLDTRFFKNRIKKWLMIGQIGAFLGRDLGVFL